MSFIGSWRTLYLYYYTTSVFEFYLEYLLYTNTIDYDYAYRVLSIQKWWFICGSMSLSSTAGGYNSYLLSLSSNDYLLPASSNTVGTATTGRDMFGATTGDITLTINPNGYSHFLLHNFQIYTTANPTLDPFSPNTPFSYSSMAFFMDSIKENGDILIWNGRLGLYDPTPTIISTIASYITPGLNVPEINFDYYSQYTDTRSLTHNSVTVAKIQRGEFQPLFFPIGEKLLDNSEWTIEGWMGDYHVDYLSDPQPTTIFGIGSKTSSTFIDLVIYKSGSPYYYARTSFGGTVSTSLSRTPPDTYIWHYFTLRLSTNNAGSSYYLSYDICTNTMSSCTSYSSMLINDLGTLNKYEYLGIGQSLLDTATFNKGLFVKNVRLWKAAMSLAQLQTNAMSPVMQSDNLQNLIASYNFENLQSQNYVIDTSYQSNIIIPLNQWSTSKTSRLISFKEFRDGPNYQRYFTECPKNYKMYFSTYNCYRNDGKFNLLINI